MTDDDDSIPRREFDLWTEAHIREHGLYDLGHVREHSMTELALDKASSSINGRLEAMNEFRAQLTLQSQTFMTRDAYDRQFVNIKADIDRLREEGKRYLTQERFERDHAAVIERVDSGLAGVNERLGVEGLVTARQDAQADLLDKLSTNNRWMIGILVTVAIFGATTVMHVFKLI